MVYDAIHDEWNPYTVTKRHKSQEFIWMPHAAPLQDSPNNITMITLSHDAVNDLHSMVSASNESVESFQSRYIVPEVIPFGSSSEVDTRSAGNPYAHHPNYTTPSQYFGIYAEEESSEATPKEEEDVLTVMDIMKLKNPFEKEPEVKIHPPNDVTINKLAFGSESLAELQQIPNPFQLKHFGPTPTAKAITSTDCLNKKLFSPESMYELGQLGEQFEEKQSNMLVVREFSPQTLADLREIRNFSEYTDFSGGPSKDVSTAWGMSPSPYERLHFEQTENVAYGGI